MTPYTQFYSALATVLWFVLPIAIAINLITLQLLIWIHAGIVHMVGLL